MSENEPKPEREGRKRRKKKRDEDGEGEQLKRVEQKGICLPLTRRPLESDRREKYQEREKQRKYSLQEWKREREREWK